MNLPQFPSHPLCTACGLSLHCGPSGHPGVPTVWLENSLPPQPGTPAAIFLGQNPGYFENQKNQPFVGRSGQIVRRAIIPGLSLHTLASIYLSNTARCYTPDETPPSPKQYSTCLSLHFPGDLSQIASARPSRLALVALGAPAATHLWRYLTGKSVKQKEAFTLNGTPVYPPPPSPGGGRGSVRSAPSGAGAFADARFFATFHPAACTRDHNLIYAISDHMQLVLDYLLDLAPTPSFPTVVPPRSPIPCD